jgi:hypothetical protein
MPESARAPMWAHMPPDWPRRVEHAGAPLICSVFCASLAQTYPQTEAEWRQRHDHVIATYARAMKAERKGGFDQMGWRGRWIVWQDLTAAPAIRTSSANAWSYRGAAWSVIKFVVSLWKMFH